MTDTTPITPRDIAAAIHAGHIPTISTVDMALTEASLTQAVSAHRASKERPQGKIMVCQYTDGTATAYHEKEVGGRRGLPDKNIPIIATLDLTPGAETCTLHGEPDVVLRRNSAGESWLKHIDTLQASVANQAAEIDALRAKLKAAQQVASDYMDAAGKSWAEVDALSQDRYAMQVARDRALSQVEDLMERNKYVCGELHKYRAVLAALKAKACAEALRPLGEQDGRDKSGNENHLVPAKACAPLGEMGEADPPEPKVFRVAFYTDAAGPIAGYAESGPNAHVNFNRPCGPGEQRHVVTHGEAPAVDLAHNISAECSRMVAEQVEKRLVEMGMTRGIAEKIAAQDREIARLRKALTVIAYEDPPPQQRDMAEIAVAALLDAAEAAHREGTP